MPYKNRDDLVQPDEGMEVWRYMDFSKFVAMLQTKSLFFASLSTFDADDPWEGYPSRANFSAARPVLVTKEPSQPGEVVGHVSTLSEVFGDQVEDFLHARKEAAARARNTFFINCWHLNSEESDSQWKLYGGNAFSVAIVSNLKRIKKSILDAQDVYGGQIRYYKAGEVIPDGNVFFPIVHKRLAFVHEREFRLIVWKPDLLKSSNTLPGLGISICLEALIERLIISPRAPTWFEQVVRTLVKDYGFAFDCSKSDLLVPFS